MPSDWVLPAADDQVALRFNLGWSKRTSIVHSREGTVLEAGKWPVGSHCVLCVKALDFSAAGLPDLGISL